MLLISGTIEITDLPSSSQICATSTIAINPYINSTTTTFTINLYITSTTTTIASITTTSTASNSTIATPLNENLLGIIGELKLIFVVQTLKILELVIVMEDKKSKIYYYLFGYFHISFIIFHLILNLTNYVTITSKRMI